MPSVIIRKKAIFEFGVGLCVLIGIAVFSYINLNQLDSAVSWVRHTYIVKENLSSLETSIRTAESNQRGYLLTKKIAYLSEFNIAIERTYTTEAYLLSLMSDNPAQVKRLRKLYVVIEQRLQVLRSVAELKEQGREAEANTIIDSSKGKQLMDRFLTQAQEIKGVEDNLLDARLQEQERTFQSATCIVIFGGVISVVIVFGAVTIINNVRYMDRDEH